MNHCPWSAYRRDFAGASIIKMASNNAVWAAALLLLSLVVLARAAGTVNPADTVYPGKCDWVGGCRTEADCAEPCAAAGHAPSAVLCIPDPTGGSTGNMCCCVLQ